MTKDEAAALLVQFQAGVARLCEREDRIIGELTAIREALQAILGGGAAGEEDRPALDELCGGLNRLLGDELPQSHGEVNREIRTVAAVIDGVARSCPGDWPLYS